MGLSGSGKSTLVRHINRLLEPTSGKIFINGQDVMTLDREKLQELRNKKIGMVFQNFALMPHRSVVDNIAMPLEIRGISKNDRLDAANKILDIVELQGWGNKFAHEQIYFPNLVIQQYLKFYSLHQVYHFYLFLLSQVA